MVLYSFKNILLKKKKEKKSPCTAQIMCIGNKLQEKIHDKILNKEIVVLTAQACFLRIKNTADSTYFKLYFIIYLNFNAYQLL